MTHATCYRHQSPKQPTHTDKTHTDTFHRLPAAISQAPDLWVCVGCLGDWAVACGMCRYVFYGCVAVAWEIDVGSLWNVSVCF